MQLTAKHSVGPVSMKIKWFFLLLFYWIIAIEPIRSENLLIEKTQRQKKRRYVGNVCGFRIMTRRKGFKLFSKISRKS